LQDKSRDTTTGAGTLNTGGGQIFDNNNIAQGFIDRDFTTVQPVVSTQLGPIYYGTGTVSYIPAGGSSTVLCDSESCRFDLAATTIDQYRTRLIRVISGNPVGTDWWTNRFCSPADRFQCNPFVTKPLSSQTFSQQMPVLLQGCTQFIVEYAGDFITQDNDPTSLTYGKATDAYFVPATGLVKSGGTDGVIDYVVYNQSPPPSNQTTQIRWYGMPRDVAHLALASNPVAGPGADGIIQGQNGARLNNDMPDVVPLRDVLQSIPGFAGLHAPFEHTSGLSNPLDSGTLPLATKTDYMTGMNSTDTYTCAWGPFDTVKPSYIRITFTVDDPSGRLADGLTYQYVFKIQ
jgi:hypothetical protein